MRFLLMMFHVSSHLMFAKCHDKLLTTVSFFSLVFLLFIRFKVIFLLRISPALFATMAATHFIDLSGSCSRSSRSLSCSRSPIPKRKASIPPLPLPARTAPHQTPMAPLPAPLPTQTAPDHKTPAPGANKRNEHKEMELMDKFNKCNWCNKAPFKNRQALLRHLHTKAGQGHHPQNCVQQFQAWCLAYTIRFPMETTCTNAVQQPAASSQSIQQSTPVPKVQQAPPPPPPPPPPPLKRIPVAEANDSWRILHVETAIRDPAKVALLPTPFPADQAYFSDKDRHTFFYKILGAAKNPKSRQKISGWRRHHFL